MSGVIVHRNVQGGIFRGKCLQGKCSGKLFRENVLEFHCSVTVSQINNNLSPLLIRHCFFEIPSWDDLYPLLSGQELIYIM